MRPQRLGLGRYLHYFLDFRLETGCASTLSTSWMCCSNGIHILKGLNKIIFNALDKAIKLIRESEGRADAAVKLMKARFDLDEIQTDAILDAPALQDRQARMEIKRILEELQREEEAGRGDREEILKSKHSYGPSSRPS